VLAGYDRSDSSILIVDNVRHFPPIDSNSWIVVPRRSYPYNSQPLNVPSPPADPFKRNAASLLASLGSFANKLSKSPTTDYTLDEIQQIGRLCTNSLTTDDFRHYHSSLFNPPIRTTSTILHFDELPSEDNNNHGKLS
jgi:hypothetical protein